MVMSGGLAGVAAGMRMGATCSSTGTSITVMRDSIFMRLWAWRALDALALKRSTKACMCARAASCFFAKAVSSARCAARVSTNVS